MKHLQEDELILHHYGEKDAPADAAQHLRECRECAAQFAALQRVLASVEAAPVPERAPDYGAQVWRNIQSQVIAREPKRGFSWSSLFGSRPLALAGAMAVLLMVAFYAGRITTQTTTGVPGDPTATANAEGVRERIMLVAVGEHLERSRMVLVELVNSPEGGPVNVSNTRAWAEDLVESNRLYRQTAAQAGDQGLSSVLDELERVLLDVAHSPDQVSQSQLDSLRKRIESRGLLFKLRVVEGQMQQRQQQTVPAQSGRTQS